jgi:hypothetical protein
VTKRWSGQAHRGDRPPAPKARKTDHVFPIAERFGDVAHDLAVTIKGISETLRVGSVAVSEARIVGRDKVIAIGK